MKIAVRYFSRSGNTKKLAESIAAAVGVEAKSISEPLTEDTDILFLGSSVYAYGVDEEVKRFVREIRVSVGQVVNFSTAALIKSTYKQVGQLLEEKGLKQAKEEFYCKGSFGPMHRGKPNENDCAAAAAFARDFIQNAERKNAENGTV